MGGNTLKSLVTPRDPVEAVDSVAVVVMEMTWSIAAAHAVCAPACQDDCHVLGSREVTMAGEMGQ